MNILFIQVSHLDSDSRLAKVFKGVCTIDDEGKLGRSMMRGK